MEGLLAVGVLLFSVTEGANILIIHPTPCFSHQQPVLALIKDLVLRGHNVTFAGANITRELEKKCTFVDLSSGYNHISKGQMKENTQVDLRKKISKWNFGYTVLSFFKIVEQQILQEPFQQFLKRVREEKLAFDVVQVEAYLLRLLSPIATLIAGPTTPIIALSTLSHSALSEEEMGNLLHYSFMPSMYDGYSNKLSLWQKLDGWLTSLFLIQPTKSRISTEVKTFLKEHFGESAEALVDYNYKNDIEDWFKGAEKGVIYFSLGSNMASTALSESAIKNFLKVFRHLPAGFRVLWKWELEGKIPGQSDNILTKRWIPQQSVLAHPKVKVFITQGGLQSFQEAVHYCVPMIVIPFFGDQLSNAGRIVDAGIGYRLETGDLQQSDSIEAALKAVLFDEKYSRSMKTLSEHSREFTAQSMEKAIFWIEHVANHGPVSFLTPSTADASYFEIFCLDLISIIIAASLFVSTSIYFMLKFGLRYFSERLRTKLKNS